MRAKLAYFVPVGKEAPKFVQEQEWARLEDLAGGYVVYLNEDVGDDSELGYSHFSEGREVVKEVLESEGYKCFTVGKVDTDSQVSRSYELSPTVHVTVSYSPDREIDYGDLGDLLDEEVRKAGLDPDELRDKEVDY